MAPSPDSRFAGLLAAELSALEASGQVREFRAGQVIFSAGETGDGFYLIESGQVDIAAALVGGDLRQLATIGPGDFFGEMAVLDDAPRSATAMAARDTRTYFLGREQLLSLLAERPTLALSLIRKFSARMRALNNKYVDEIIQAERLATVGRFASTIVHDFKNPLATIALAAELAGANETSPALRQRAQIQIERQITRMSNMLTELIEFTRSSDRRPPPAPVDFAAFITPVLAELADELVAREIVLEVPTPPPAVELRIDPTRLSRVLFNLVGNAVDVLPRGGRIIVRFALESAKLRFDVEDTGPGIAPAIALQLFQPFATHGKAHGTGLGLSICKKIVEDHAGRIWVTSPPGRGATFSVSLPRPN